MISSLPLFTDADYSNLNEMGLLQVAQTAYPRESSLVDLFRQQGSACPSKIAVRDPREEITYAQLDEASDLLSLSG